jgi:hypothetical protein
LPIELTPEERERENVENWESCLSEKKFWILFERFNNGEMNFKNFLDEVNNLRGIYREERMTLSYFRNTTNETARKEYVTTTHLSESVIEKIKKIADSPEELYREFPRRKIKADV